VEREPIRVTYLPDAPSSYRIEGQKDDWVLPVVFGILGSILTALGGFVFLRGLSQFQRSRGSRKGMPS